MNRQRELGLILMNLAEVYREPIQWSNFDLTDFVNRIYRKMDADEQLFLDPLLEKLKNKKVKV